MLSSPVLDVLVGPHGIDRYLELIRPDLTVGEARAEITAVRHQTDRSVTLTLAPNGAWRGFAAGQYVLFGVEIDGVRRTRTYSPASSEHEQRLEFTITLHPHGLVSRYLRSRAVPGTLVHLGTAQGSFALPVPRPQRLALISGGSGITPVLSMLRTLCEEDHGGEIVFLHYARTARDWLYREEVDGLARKHGNLRVRYEATREGGARLTPVALGAAGLDPDDSQAAVCGPRPLIDAVRKIWAGPVLAETFAPPGIPSTDNPAPDASIRFRRSGTAIPADGRTLLESAEAAGLCPEFGCRMGICGTCRRRKIAGRVLNLRTGEISNDLDEDVRLCVSVPAGDVTLDI